MKWLVILMDLRKMWKSKTINFARLLALVPTIDLAFFQGETGVWLVQKSVELVNLLPFLEVSSAQMVSFLIVVIGGLVGWLRQVTVEPLENKA